MPDLTDWKFWVDVGGTFTDCLALGPGGELRSLKVLSSGAFKGRVPREASREALRDPAWAGFPKEFFRGWALSLLGPRGEVLGTGEIASFDAAGGVLHLSSPLADPPSPGGPYELRSGEEAPLVAVRRLLGLTLDVPLLGLDLRLGTTVGTNALLERRGARTVLLTTKGFEDLLAIGTQDRPELFALQIDKPARLYDAVVGVDERVDARGKVLVPLREEEARRALSRAREEGARSLAVCLLNAYRNPAHEELLCDLARREGFASVSVSTRLSPSVKIVPRGQTTVLDAYLSPVVGEYLEGLGQRIGRGSVRVMTSAGGLVGAETFSGKDSLLSGPAGGVVGFARVAREEGFERAVGFDMGGTSTDVSRTDGEFEMEFETRKAGVRITAPMLAIETVAAGGGSVCGFDGQKLVVGPRSAGADPGPACYGKGGPLTITDVNLFLGRIAAEEFPFDLDSDAVHRRLAETADRVRSGTGRAMSARELALGFRRIADANMAAPIRKISVSRGIDVRAYAMVAFGGAGPQHACAVARILGIRTIVLHPHGGVLSALGIGTADVRKFGEFPVLERCTPQTLPGLAPRFRALEEKLVAAVRSEGIPPGRIRAPRRLLDLRYEGEGSVLTVDGGPTGDFLRAFTEKHRRAYGHAYTGRAVEITAGRVEVTGETETPLTPEAPLRTGRPRSRSTALVSFEGDPQPVPVYGRADLVPGDRFDGPALVLEETSTIVVEPGWEAEMTARRNLVLTDRDEGTSEAPVTAEVDPVTLEIFHNHFAGIAERMGEVLRRTAFSTNIKERLDFSCALFDPGGGLVANAPHIPVHLGAMGETLRSLCAEVADLRPGNVYLTNDPACGGSHLPDLTVLSPVFGSDGTLAFFTACRAHHAEIGGSRPGSMPPDSRNLAEEGVVFRHFLLVRDGAMRTNALREALGSAAHPSRQPGENIADLEAQIAANTAGAAELTALVGRYGPEVVRAYMGHIQMAAERMMRRSISRLRSGTHRFEDFLDDGTRIAVAITVRGDEAEIDFKGTAGVHPGNFNAGSGVARAAVLYCFRLLLDEEIPLNEGVLAPLRIRVPGGLLSPPSGPDPRACPAVAAGNVETSQRVVDVILGALGRAAASQGTMNNLAFGDETFSYYETLGGGAGAGEGFDGASAVHTHMTNTRLTDAEVLEARFPVRVRSFGVRRGSGGAGLFRGGDGMVREIEFLSPCEVSIISGRRTIPPYGLEGGRPGKTGENLLYRAGEIRPEVLGPVCTFAVAGGDRLVVKTPGGGGWGAEERGQRE
jgi:5-oxoprolinase (ATP-hydrolysing)